MGDLEKYVRSNYIIDAKANKFRVPEEIVKNPAVIEAYTGKEVLIA